MSDQLHRKILSRRGLIVGTGMAALLAPVLRKMDVEAAEGESPCRTIFIYCPNGPIVAAGPCQGGERNFTFHPWWAPLERHKDSGIFFSHLSCTGAGVVEGANHGLGGQTFGGWGTRGQFEPAGITVDQLIGRRLEAENRAGVRGVVTWGNASRSEAGGTGEAFATDGGQLIRPTVNPHQAWNELFFEFMEPSDPSDPAAQARAELLIAKKKSVLDFAARDCEKLRDGLGAEGMRLFEQHCETVRSMEQGLSVAPPVAAGGCTRPADPGERNWTDPNLVDDQSTAFVELMTMTLACELTHVIGYQYGSQAARNRLADGYGVPYASVASGPNDVGPAHHPWTHKSVSAANMQLAMEIFTKFYMTQIASLLDSLATTNDASGAPLLDSTMVVVLSELGGHENNGNPHPTGCVPAMVFGGGSKFNHGRYIKGPSPNTGNGGAGNQEAGRWSAGLLLAAAHHMGFEDFGELGATGVSAPLDLLYT